MDGGLGVRVAQVVAETAPCPMEFVGIQDTYAESGQPDELLEKYGLVARDVAAAVRKVVARKAVTAPNSANRTAVPVSPMARKYVRRRCLAEAFLEQSPACHWVVTAAGVFHAHLRRPRAHLRQDGFAELAGRPAAEALDPGAGQRVAGPLRPRPRRRNLGAARAPRRRHLVLPCFPSASADEIRYAGGLAREITPGAPPSRNCATPCWARSRPRNSSATWSPSSSTTWWARTSPRWDCNSTWSAWTWKASRRRPAPGSSRSSRLLEAMMEEVREYSYELNPSAVERAGLRSALDRLATRIRGRFTGALRVNVDPSLKLDPKSPRPCITSPRRRWRTPCNIPVAPPSKSR